MSQVIVKEIDFGGRKLRLETGRLALQADASVLATWGETVVLATVATQPAAEDLGYFPLSVEYVEKYYAGGRITGQKFIKRETRPSDEAVLSGRAIDRSIRPLFPKDFPNEVQVMVTVLSFDGVSDPVLLGLIASSAALSISSVPWAGPLGVVRLGKKNGEQILNPHFDELEHLDLDLLVASTAEKVVMIEAEAKEIPDGQMLEAIKKAYQEAQPMVEVISEFVKEAGKEKQKVAPLSEEVDHDLLEEIKKEAKERIEKALTDQEHPWHEGTADLIKDELAIQYAEKTESRIVSQVFEKVAQEMMHDLVLNKGRRVDGRAMDEVRMIEIEIGVLPRTHGSALFQRGGTQVLSIATLGPLSVSQTLEGMTGESTKRFMHHYNMGINPFAVGEVKRIGAPSRRDIGHGALVEKSFTHLLPAEEEFPYAVRIVSEVLGANASTSMASVCASTLALLNSGVRLIRPVAGIALGLLSSGEKYQVITDMQAAEDFYGDMDFKVTGTTTGVTAIQMDTKLNGLSFEIIQEALKQGNNARNFIIGKINEVIPEASEISRYAPKIEVTHIKPEEIGLLIGTGGKTINALIARTGAQVDIEDDGTVMVSSASEEAVKNAIVEIEGMFKQVQVGEVYDGKVVKITSFGAFVEMLPGKEGLVHVSQMAPHRVENPEDVVQVGQPVKVRVSEVTPEGKVGLSMLFGEDARRLPPRSRREFRPRQRFDRPRFDRRDRRN